MLHYHVTPITPLTALQEMAGRNFCVSFSRPEQVARCHNIGQSIMLDNGAYSAWTRGTDPKWDAYYEWCEPWLDFHTTWAVIPDVIDGTEEENDLLIGQWPHGTSGAPVWHLNESLARLLRLCDEWPRVCFGSSGRYAEPRSPSWHRRIAEAFTTIAPRGKVPAWIHMLRGMRYVGSEYPFASADSAYLARNHSRQGGPVRLASKFDSMQCPATWHGVTNVELPCTD